MIIITECAIPVLTEALLLDLFLTDQAWRLDRAHPLESKLTANLDISSCVYVLFVELL